MTDAADIVSYVGTAVAACLMASQVRTVPAARLSRHYDAPSTSGVTWAFAYRCSGPYIANACICVSSAPTVGRSLQLPAMFVVVTKTKDVSHMSVLPTVGEGRTL
jgi:hypothetical protein